MVQVGDKKIISEFLLQKDGRWQGKGDEKIVVFVTINTISQSDTDIATTISCLHGY